MYIFIHYKKKSSLKGRKRRIKKKNYKGFQKDSSKRLSAAIEERKRATADAKNPSIQFQKGFAGYRIERIRVLDESFDGGLSPPPF